MRAVSLHPSSSIGLPGLRPVASCVTSPPQPSIQIGVNEAFRGLPVVVEAMNKKGNRNVHYVHFDDIGDDLRPDVANHRKMSDMLIEAMTEVTG